MSTTDPRDEAILALAGAIRRSNTNRDVIEMADRAEMIVRGTQRAQKHAAQLAEAVAEKARLESLEEAHQWMKKHMPVSVSNFGGSNGVFGWTGTDAAGNRVTWKVEPPSVAGVSKGSTGLAITDAMHALAERAVQLRDDELNQLTFSLMTKLNAEAFREFLDADARRSEVASAASEVP